MWRIDDRYFIIDQFFNIFFPKISGENIIVFQSFYELQCILVFILDYGWFLSKIGGGL